MTDTNEQSGYKVYIIINEEKEYIVTYSYDNYYRLELCLPGGSEVIGNYTRRGLCLFLGLHDSSEFVVEISYMGFSYVNLECDDITDHFEKFLLILSEMKKAT
jgi:hypothetical protein